MAPSVHLVGAASEKRRARPVRRSIAGLFLITSLGVPVTGCVTVGGAPSGSIAPSSSAKARAGEREALVEAASAVAPIAWQAPAQPTFADRLWGVANDQSSQPKRRDIIDGYVDRLQGASDPVEALEQDASQQLDAAERLIATAEQALDAIEPRMSDVGVLEAAIADLRVSRSIYLSALRQIKTNNDEDERASVSLTRIRVKTGFDVAIKQVGDLASELADRAMTTNVQRVAEPGVATNRFRLK